MNRIVSQHVTPIPCGTEPPPIGESPASACEHAIRHALVWLCIGNAVGLYLAVLLLQPTWDIAPWTYGRWMPVHLNVQLYGWLSLPLVGWLFSLYEIEKTRHASWAHGAVCAWSAALAIGILHWLSGTTSGKIFLDWKQGSLWALVTAQSILWAALVASWRARRHTWPRARRIGLLVGLVALALVPFSLVVAASPKAYPPIDPSTGGPTGSSLLGSTLVVIGLMLLLPRMATTRTHHAKSAAMWIFFGVSWLVFVGTEIMGGTHRDVRQIIPMLLLLPWALLIPQDWKHFQWPEGSAVWRHAMLGWWAVLVCTGVALFQNQILDHFKFTQGLVAHTHMAMAGFTTSFCALLCVLLTRRPLGSHRSVACWHLATLLMVLTLAACGWQEGNDFHWMAETPPWRTTGLILRGICGTVMGAVSLHWLLHLRRS